MTNDSSCVPVDSMGDGPSNQLHHSPVSKKSPGPSVASKACSCLGDMGPDIVPPMAEGRMPFTILLVATFVPVALHAQSCESLSKLVSPTVSITLAKTIDAGAFTPAESSATFPHLPAFCRVAANLKPTSDSDIGTEIWLPISGWNGKFLAVGNGGWGGSISSTSYDDMADALRRGYATSATDDGHTAGAPASSWVTRRSSSTSPTALSAR